MGSVLREGFREIGRKWRRTQLRRRIAAADREHTRQLRALGQRAWETQTAGPGPEGMADRIAGAEAQEKEIASRLSALDEQRKELEERRQAETARFASLLAEVEKRKASVDADPAARRALQAELDRIAGQRKQALGELDRALAEVRRGADAARAQAASVGAQKADHFAELGRKLAAAGAVDPALAAEMRAVRAAEESRAALQVAHATLAAQSRAMPAGTMAKFSALALAGVLAVSTGAYATSRALTSLRPVRTEQGAAGPDRRMPSIIPGGAQQPQPDKRACEPLRAACQHATEWFGCTQGALNTMTSQVAQARAEAAAELGTAQARGDPLAPGLVQLVTALDRTLGRVVSVQTTLATSAAEFGMECAKLPGPEDRAECQRAAARVEDVVRKTRETLQRELEQEISVLDAGTAAAAASPTRTRLLGTLRAALSQLKMCR